MNAICGVNVNVMECNLMWTLMYDKVLSIYSRLIHEMVLFCFFSNVFIVPKYVCLYQVEYLSRVWNCDFFYYSTI